MAAPLGADCCCWTHSHVAVSETCVSSTPLCMGVFVLVCICMLLYYSRYEVVLVVWCYWKWAGSCTAVVIVLLSNPLLDHDRLIGQSHSKIAKYLWFLTPKVCNCSLSSLYYTTFHHWSYMCIGVMYVLGATCAYVLYMYMHIIVIVYI